MSYRMSNYQHVPCKIVEHQHIENLLKLRKYLIELPEDYDRFDMEAYAYNRRTNESINPQKLRYTCNTAACAAGHTFAAGVLSMKARKQYTNWNDVTQAAYGMKPCGTRSLEWIWCFDGAWADYDNTPQGAGHRIGYMVEFGVPVEIVSSIAKVVFSPAIYQPVE